MKVYYCNEDDPCPPTCQAVTLMAAVISLGVKVSVIRCDVHSVACGNGN